MRARSNLWPRARKGSARAPPLIGDQGHPKHTHLRLAHNLVPRSPASPHRGPSSRGANARALGANATATSVRFSGTRPLIGFAGLRERRGVVDAVDARVRDSPDSVVSALGGHGGGSPELPGEPHRTLRTARCGPHERSAPRCSAQPHNEPGACAVEVVEPIRFGPPRIGPGHLDRPQQGPSATLEAPPVTRLTTLLRAGNHPHNRKFPHAGANPQAVADSTHCDHCF